MKNNPKKCLSCGGCVGICPNDAIKLENMRIVIDKSKCTNCGLCRIFCPVGAMEKEEE